MLQSIFEFTSQARPFHPRDLGACLYGDRLCSSLGLALGGGNGAPICILLGRIDHGTDLVPQLPPGALKREER